MKIADWAKDEIKELIDAAYMDDPARQRKDVVRIVTDQIRAWREDLAEYLREIGPQHVIESGRPAARVRTFATETKRRKPEERHALLVQVGKEER